MAKEDNASDKGGTKRQPSPSDVFEFLAANADDPFSEWTPNPGSPMDFFRAIGRQLLPLTFFPLIAIVAGLTYAVLETPTYSSSARLQYTAAENDADTLNASLLSHIQNIRSVEVASKVAETLEFGSSVDVQRGKLHSVVLDLRSNLDLENPTQLTDAERQSLLIERVREKLDVGRLDDAAIIEVTYSSEDPERSAEIANLFVEVFLNDLVLLRSEESERRAQFLKTRIAALEQSAIGAIQDAQMLRKDGNLEFGGIVALEARLNQLTESISNLKETEASISARFALLKSSNDTASLEAAALQADGGAELFNAYLRAQSTLEKVKAGGALPQSVAQIEATVDQYLEGLSQLIERTRNGLAQELKIISARRESVQDDFNSALEQTSSASWSGIRIAEHQAGVLQGLYAQHLRDLEAVYEGAVSEQFRRMAVARPGVAPSWPDYKLVLVLSGVIGLLLGVIFAAMREADRPLTEKKSAHRSG